MRIGLLGGTFDPVHMGHLHEAREMLKRHHLDEIWLIPANISPHKLDHPPVHGKHRLNMVKLAIADEPHFKVLNIELEREGPSYTIDTVKEILSNYDHTFYLIISDDMVSALPDWQDVKKLIKLIPILVGKREGKIRPTGDPEIDAIVKKGFTDMPILNVSATDLRGRLARGLSCKELVHASVLAYIIDNHLYRR